jgi:hypothetical protein
MEVNTFFVKIADRIHHLPGMKKGDTMPPAV